MAWIIATTWYLVIGFLVFKAKYNRDMAKAILRLHKAKEAHEAEVERTKKQRYYYVSPYVARELSDAKHAVSIRKPMIDAISLGVVWPVHILWGIGKLLGKLINRVMFGGNVDKVAQQRADKLFAEHLRVKELEAEKKRLMALAQEEGLIQ